MLRCSSAQVTKDWENREVVEVVRMNVLSLTNFLTQFGACSTLVATTSCAHARHAHDPRTPASGCAPVRCGPGCRLTTCSYCVVLHTDASVRDRLAQMNEKLTVLERTLAYVGAARS